MNEKIENLLKEERKFPPSKQLTENAKSGRDTKLFLQKTFFKMAMFDECHSGWVNRKRIRIAII